MTTGIEGTRLLAISDIHGRKQGLLGLLQAAQYIPGKDRLMLLGDYIDADNPASWHTLDFIRELTAQGAKAIPGNQELKLAAYLKRGHARRRISNKHRQYVNWISELPHYLTTDDLLFVHAGIRPGIPLAKQTVRDLTEIREEFYTHPVEELSAYIDLENSNAPTVAWRKIIFGHTYTFKLGAAPGNIWTDARRIAIDTGAKHGQRLTLLDVGGAVAYSCLSEENYGSGDFRVSDVSQWLCT